MNDNDLEKKLLALTAALHRPDPTPGWKADILARARREAGVTPMQRTLPPRWLMLGWAAAWAAILAMNFSMPKDPERHAALDSLAPTRKQTPPAANLTQGDLSALIAFYQQKNLNLDPP